VLAVVPVYDCPLYIVTRTIKSLITQDYQDLKVIVIDDCSPGSLFTSLYEAFSSFPNLTLIRNEINLGFANTLNKALGLGSDEEFLLILEHDCELLSPSYISEAIKNFHNARVGAVCGENLLPPPEELSPMKRIFVNHLSEDVHDTSLVEVGFLLLKADVFRIDVLRKCGGFESAGHWKFASEEHIISKKIRSLGYTILKDPRLQFRAYWGGQENLKQNLRKEALYGRGLGYSLATKSSDLQIGNSNQLKSKRFGRIIQLFYVVTTFFCLFLMFYSLLIATTIALAAFLVYLVPLIWGTRNSKHAFKNSREKLLFIITGYLRAWVYIPNFLLGIVYGSTVRSRRNSNLIPESRMRKDSV